MKKLVLLVLGILLLGVMVSADCVVPYDGMIITQDTTFCTGDYYLPNGISIGADNIILDCNNSILKGEEIIYKYGVMISQKSNNVIKNCLIKNYTAGIMIIGSSSILVENNIIFNRVFDNNYEHAYSGISTGGGVSGVIIKNNTIFNGFEAIGAGPYSNTQIIANKIDGSFVGISLWISENNVVKQNLIENSVYGITFDCSLLVSCKYNQVEENVLNNIAVGVYFRGNALYNNITRNILNNSQLVLLEEPGIPKSEYNTIWNNSFYRVGVYNISLGENYFCLNGVGNSYYDGATGPICPPISNDSDNDGVLDSEDKCPNTIGEQIVYGCSCKQILDLVPGKNKGLEKNGCSKGVINVFTKQIGWARDLF